MGRCAWRAPGRKPTAKMCSYIRRGSGCRACGRPGRPRWRTVHVTFAFFAHFPIGEAIPLLHEAPALSQSEWVLPWAGSQARPQPMRVPSRPGVLGEVGLAGYVHRSIPADNASLLRALTKPGPQQASTGQVADSRVAWDLVRVSHDTDLARLRRSGRVRSSPLSLGSVVE